MVSSYFNPQTGMTATSTTSFSTSTVYTESDSRVDTDTDTDLLDSDNDGGSITSSFSSMTSAGGVSALIFGNKLLAWSMNDSESPTLSSGDDDIWGNSTITFQETGGSPTINSASYNVTYNNSLSAGIVTVPAAASAWIQKVQEFEVGQSAPRLIGLRGLIQLFELLGASSSTSAGHPVRQGHPARRPRRHQARFEFIVIKLISPRRTGNAPAAAAAGPAARAAQAPPLPTSGGMMVTAGAMTMPAMNGTSFGGGSGRLTASRLKMTGGSNRGSAAPGTGSSTPRPPW